MTGVKKNIPDISAWGKGTLERLRVGRGADRVSPVILEPPLSSDSNNKSNIATRLLDLETCLYLNKAKPLSLGILLWWED